MPVVQFNPRKQSDPASNVRTFESATAELLSEQYPWAKRSVLYVLALMLVLIVVFISFAHLDRIVTATGRIVPARGALTVQPLDKAIISSILVAVGDTVKKGQVLATLDPTFVQADLSQFQQKVASLSPERRRREAEEAGQTFQPNPAQPYDLLQETIFKQRATEYDAGVREIDHKISSTEAQLTLLHQSIGEYQDRLKIAQETEEMNRKLESQGVVSHLAFITVQDARIELDRKLGEVENTLPVTEQTLESLKQERKVFIDKWHDDNLTNLVTVRNQLDEAKEDQTKAKKHSDLSNLVSPVDAVVLKVPNISLGGVATDAEPLFSLMPINAALEADVQIDAKDRGFVQVGDPVRIKFEAYKYMEHGTGEGVVKTISQDSFTEVNSQDAISTTQDKSDTTTSRAPYFDARITVTAIKLHDVPPGVHLLPGMTLDADIIVGRRTILWYLLGGALRSGAEAMREP